MRIRWTDIKNGESIEYSVEHDGEIQESYVAEHGWHKVSSPSPELIRKACFHRTVSEHPWGPLYWAVLRSVHETMSELCSISHHDFERIFARADVGPARKSAFAVDLVAECNAARRIREGLLRHDYRGLTPMILGEESLPDQCLDVAALDKPVIVLDAADGTDELEQGFREWCSAAVIYYPPENEILGAFVAVPGIGTYFAMGAVVGKCRFAGPSISSPEIFDLPRPQRVGGLEESLLAFYGQKPARLEALYRNKNFLSLLRILRDSPRARIRSQGGNPMMLKMIDAEGSRRVDAVFDLLGQAPHDMIPGAYIACRAGATLCDLRYQPIHLPSLLRRPADPLFRTPYICASHPELAWDLCRYLGEPAALVPTTAFPPPLAASQEACV